MYAHTTTDHNESGLIPCVVTKVTIDVMIAPVLKKTTISITFPTKEFLQVEGWIDRMLTGS